MSRIATVDLRKDDVVLETDRYRIAGKMTLPAEAWAAGCPTT